MNTRIVGISILAAHLLLLTGARAQVPMLFNYQGRVTDRGSLVNGVVPVRFTLLDHPTLGKAKYTELDSVQVVDGLYATTIGDNGNPVDLRNALASPEVWLEVEIDGTVLSPRERVTSVMYAFVAGSVTNDAITAAMIAPDAVEPAHLAATVADLFVDEAGDAMTGPLDLPDNGLTVGGNDLVVASGRVGVGVSSPSSALDVAGDVEVDGNVILTDGDWIGIGSGQERIEFDAGSNHINLLGAAVGIGTGSPDYTLDMVGSLRVQLGDIRVQDDHWIGIGPTAERIIFDGSGSDVEIMGANVGIGTLSPSAPLTVVGNARVEQGGLQLQDEGWVGIASSTERIVFDTSGDVEIQGADVGIGTSAPSAKLDVVGDLEVSGAYKGNIGPNNGAPFPRPAYDSGWVDLAEGETSILTHNVGGDVDNYVVDLQFLGASLPPVLSGFGVNVYYSGGEYGGWWKNLTSTSISITRAAVGIVPAPNDKMRVRIWVYN